MQQISGTAWRRIDVWIISLATVWSIDVDLATMSVRDHASFKVMTLPSGSLSSGFLVGDGRLWCKLYVRGKYLMHSEWFQYANESLSQLVCHHSFPTTSLDRSTC